MGIFTYLATPNWAPLSSGGSRLPMADNPQQLPHPSPLSAPAVLIRALSVSSLSMYEHAWPRARAGTWLQQRHAGFARSCGARRCAGWVRMGACMPGWVCMCAHMLGWISTSAGVSVHGRVHAAVGVHRPVHVGAAVRERTHAGQARQRSAERGSLPTFPSPHLLPEPCAPLTFAVSHHRKHLLLQRPALS